MFQALFLAAGIVTTLATPQVVDAVATTAPNATTVTAAWHSTPAAGDVGICESGIANLIWMTPSTAALTGWSQYGEGGAWPQAFAPQAFMYHGQGQPFATVYTRVMAGGGAAADAIPTFGATLNTTVTVTPNGSMGLMCFRVGAANANATYPIDRVQVTPIGAFTTATPAQTIPALGIGELRLSTFFVNSESSAAATTIGFNRYPGLASTSGAAPNGYDTLSVVNASALSPTTSTTANTGGTITPTVSATPPSGSANRAVEVDVLVNTSTATDGGFVSHLPEASDKLARSRSQMHVEWGQSQYAHANTWMAKVHNITGGTESPYISLLSATDVLSNDAAYTEAKTYNSAYHDPMFIAVGSCMTQANFLTAIQQMETDGFTIAGSGWTNEGQTSTFSCVSPSTWLQYYQDPTYGFQAMKNAFDGEAAAHPANFTSPLYFRGPSNGGSFGYDCNASQARPGNCLAAGIGGLDLITGSPSVAIADKHPYAANGHSGFNVYSSTSGQCPQAMTFRSYACIYNGYTGGSGNIGWDVGERGPNTYNAAGYTPLEQAAETIEQDTFTLALQGSTFSVPFNSIDGTSCSGAQINLGPLPNFGATLNAAITASGSSQTIPITARAGSGTLNVGDSVHVTDSTNNTLGETVTALAGSSQTQLVAVFTLNHASGDGIGEGSTSGAFGGNGLMYGFVGSTCPPITSGTDYVLKPSYALLQSQIMALADPGTAYSPTPVSYTLSGTSSTTITFLTQKRTGESTLWFSNGADVVNVFGTLWSSTRTTNATSQTIGVHFPANQTLGTVYEIQMDKNTGDAIPNTCPAIPSGATAGTASPGWGCFTKTILTPTAGVYTVTQTGADFVGLRWGV